MQGAVKLPLSAETFHRKKITKQVKSPAKERSRTTPWKINMEPTNHPWKNWNMIFQTSTPKNKRMPLKKNSVDSCETCVLDLVLHCPNWCVKLVLCPNFLEGQFNFGLKCVWNVSSKTFTLRNQHIIYIIIILYNLIIKKNNWHNPQLAHTPSFTNSPALPVGKGGSRLHPWQRGCAAKEQKRLISSLVQKVVDFRN